MMARRTKPKSGPDDDQPGTVMLIDEATRKLRIVEVESLAPQLRVVRMPGAIDEPVLMIMRMKNGMIGLYGRNRRLLSLISEQQAPEF